MQASQPQIEVAAAVIEKEGRFLITQRLAKSHLGHRWEFPGGKLEPGESSEDCVVRECREELGISVKPIRKLQELIHEYPDVKVHLHFWLCEHLSGNPKPLECADLRWSLPEELHQYEFPEADGILLKQLAAGRLCF